VERRQMLKVYILFFITVLMGLAVSEILQQKLTSAASESA
jgi:hypothetical protein